METEYKKSPEKGSINTNNKLLDKTKRKRKSYLNT